MYFHPKSIENLGKNSSSVNTRFIAKTSDIRNLSQNIRIGNTDDGHTCGKRFTTDRRLLHHTYSAHVKDNFQCHVPQQIRNAKFACTFQLLTIAKHCRNSEFQKQDQGIFRTSRSTFTYHSLINLRVQCQTTRVLGGAG